jgi:hypothetical protein
MQGMVQMLNGGCSIFTQRRALLCPPREYLHVFRDPDETLTMGLAVK